MAITEHVEILRQGVGKWNQWREDHPEIIPDLSEADLSEMDLRESDLSKADLRDADFGGARLNGANLSEADLSNAMLGLAILRRANLRGARLRRARLGMADLIGADLIGANLSDADIGEANLSEANLSRADLSRADLIATILGRTNLIGANLNQAVLIMARLLNADLSEANLRGADLRVADLRDAILNEAKMGFTIFGDNDLSSVIGLDSVKHYGPSTIGIVTLYKSCGKIPDVFLRGCGVPDNFIEYVGSLTGRPWEFYSCFISYSSKNQDLAERIYADLQSNGVRCWYAPEDLKIGDKFRIRIDESIRVYDKLLLVLSEHSVASQWVEKEVETAMECERKRGRDTTILFPIKLDDAIESEESGWAADIRRTRHIGDFRKWKTHDDCQKAFNRLLRDLRSENAGHKDEAVRGSSSYD